MAHVCFESIQLIFYRSLVWSDTPDIHICYTNLYKGVVEQRPNKEEIDLPIRNGEKVKVQWTGIVEVSYGRDFVQNCSIQFISIYETHFSFLFQSSFFSLDKLDCSCSFGEGLSQLIFKSRFLELAYEWCSIQMNLIECVLFVN